MNFLFYFLKIIFYKEKLDMNFECGFNLKTV